MNNRDRKLIERVHRCLAVPFAASGTQSTTMRGMAGFHDDMRVVLPMARDLLYWIANSEPWPGAIEEELEKWFHDKTSNKWSR